MTACCLVCLLIIILSGTALYIVRVPYAPTPAKNVKIIIDKLKIKPHEVFYDLGCGDGRFLLAAEKRGARARGFEISLQPYLQAKYNLRRNHSRAEIRFSNFYQADLSDADAVFCFLVGSVMPKVEAKLRAELKPGARIACYGFKLPTWQEDELIYLNPEKKSGKLYLYKK